MKIVVQRVSRAAVVVREEEIASIEKGLLLLAGFDKSDTESRVRAMAEKVLKFRIFSDQEGRMNHSVIDVQGEVLLAPNFTLCANTEKGNRPGFGSAAPPDKAKGLFNYMAKQLGDKIGIETGRFGAHMEVTLMNDGPVTFVLEG